MAAELTKIRYRDLVGQNDTARMTLEIQRERLEKKKKDFGTLTKEDKKSLERVEKILKAPKAENVDSLFVAVRDSFNDGDAVSLPDKVLVNHKNGVLETTPKNKRAAKAQFSDEDATRVAYVIGLLAADKVPVPRVTADGKNLAGTAISVDKEDPAYENFTKAFYAALGEVRGSFALALLVLRQLKEEGDRLGAPDEVNTTEFATVMRCLRKKSVTAKENQLRRKVNECLDAIQAVGVDKSVADLTIALPNLNGNEDYHIQKGNVEAIGPIICAAMFDELKAFQVVDTIVAGWQDARVAIAVSDAGRMLYDYWKSAPNRMSEAERRNFYALTMGIPGGPVNASANRDFNDLWIRFVSSVSALVRQKTLDQILRQTVPASIHQQQVRKAARDLAFNLSLHGYGMVNYAARDLQDQITKMIALLSHPDILNAYGARDMWQVIDQVATLELGGARNSARYRTLATCGAIITKWLSQNLDRFNSATKEVIRLNEVVSNDPPTSGDRATSEPTDYDLVNACELWLADTAVSDNRVEEMSQPREAPAMTSQPVQIPGIARDLLAQSLPGFTFGQSAPRH